MTKKRSRARKMADDRVDELIRQMDAKLLAECVKFANDEVAWHEMTPDALLALLELIVTEKRVT